MKIPIVYFCPLPDAQDQESKQAFFSACRALRCPAVAAELNSVSVYCQDVKDALAGLARLAALAPRLDTLSVMGGDRLDSPDTSPCKDLSQFLRACKSSPQAASVLAKVKHLHLHVSAALSGCAVLAASCNWPVSGEQHRTPLRRRQQAMLLSRA